MVDNLKPDPMIMRISGKSDVHKCASALVHAIRERPSVLMRMLGAGPTQQACKAIAIASGRLRVEGIDIISRVSLTDEVQEDGKTLTILSIQVVRNIY